MRQFARPFPIDRLSLEARVLYTAFLLFLLAGLASSVWLYSDSFEGLSASGVKRYYHGSGDAPAAEQEGAHGGPAIELPDGEAAPAGPPLRVEKPPRQVIETFHFHLFTVPVVLLIVGHLFMLTSLRIRLKVGVISVASLSTLLHLFAPLWVRFGSGALAWTMPATVVLAALAWLPMMVWPLWEMWRPTRSAAPEEAG